MVHITGGLSGYRLYIVLPFASPLSFSIQLLYCCSVKVVEAKGKLSSDFIDGSHMLLHVKVSAASLTIAVEQKIGKWSQRSKVRRV